MQQDYTVFYQRKEAGDYLARVPALGWSVTAPTREEAHQKVRAAMPEWFTAVQQTGREVEEDAEVFRLRKEDGGGQITVTRMKMSDQDKVAASEIGTFAYCQEAWRRDYNQKLAGRERLRGARQQTGPDDQAAAHKKQGAAEQSSPAPPPLERAKNWLSERQAAAAGLLSSAVERAGHWREFCKALWRLRERRKEREQARERRRARERERGGGDGDGERRGRLEGVAGAGRRDRTTRRKQGTAEHEDWRRVWQGLSTIMTWGGVGVAGAVVLGGAGVMLDRLDVPFPRGLLLGTNLVVEVAATLLGCALVVLGEVWCLRYRVGFGLGWTLSADDITLRAPAMGLVGKPDRIILRGGHIIPEERKPQLEVQDSYEAQLGAYFVLIEEHYEKWPPYGFLVLGDGGRRKIPNSKRLRETVEKKIRAIRAARKNLQKSLAGADHPKKCRDCSAKDYCEVKPRGA